jgi:hypothetical protein
MYQNYTILPKTITVLNRKFPAAQITGTLWESGEILFTHEKYFTKWNP